MVVCTSRINLLLYSTMILMKPLHEICSRICILSANILNNSSIIIIDNSNNMSGVNGNKVYIISSSLCKVKSYNESHLLCVIVINSSMFVFLIFLTLKDKYTTKYFSNDISTLHKSVDSRHT